jgi:hypothetical protein
LIIDLREMRLIEMTEPETATGKYRSVEFLEKGEVVRLNLGKGEFLNVDVTELLP